MHKERRLNITALFLLFAWTISSCEDNNPGDGGNNKTDDSKFELQLSFNGQIDNEPLPPVGQSIFKTKYGNELFMITNWAMIFSDLALVTEDDDTVRLGDGYQWVDLRYNRNKFTYKGIPKQRYKGIQFTMGLDSAVNHGDPSVWAADHPLNPLMNGLHWGWSGGYIFQAMDGRYKVHEDSFAYGFSYHTATMQFVTRYFLPLEEDLSGDKHHIAVNINADRFFGNASLNEGILFADDPVSHSEGDHEEEAMRKFLDHSLYGFRVNLVE